MADASLITFSTEINLGQIGVIVSIAGSAMAFYVKSRLDVQRLTLENRETRDDVVEMKSDMKAMKQTLGEIQMTQSANTALMSMGGILKDLPTELAKAVGRAEYRRSTRHQTQQEQN